MDLIYGKEKLLPRVTQAERKEMFNILLTFDNGEQRVFDATPLLPIPAYDEIFRDFSAFRVSFGTLIWPGGVDISPEMLYLESVPIDEYELSGGARRHQASSVAEDQGI